MTSATAPQSQTLHFFLEAPPRTSGALSCAKLVCNVVENFSIRSGASSSLTGGTLKSKNQIIKADQQCSLKRVCCISTMTGTKELRIGVFIPVGAQLLDLSPIDLFSMITPDYLRACTLPTPIVNLGTPCTIHYISMPGNEHIEMTAQAFLRISKTTEDKEVQPGMLDTLLVPGPDPSTIFDAKVLEFVRAHAIWRGSDGKLVDILSVCTGCILLGQSEILRGKKASGPRAIVPKLRKDFPDTTWIDDKRWVKDGNIWTSGGITNGQEMIAEYIRENFPGPASEAALAMADVGQRGIEYTNSKSSDTLWWFFQILKALTMGNGKKKKV